MEHPLISVIVPVYQSEQCLSRCVLSIQHQTIKNIEIILVDDGSTDESGKICDEFSYKDKRIKVIHKTNGGASSARNVGLDVASGSYIGFVDSDDWIELDMYQNLYNLIQVHQADIAIAEIVQNSRICPQSDANKKYKIEVWDQSRALDNFFRINGEKDTHSVCGSIINKKLFAQWKFIEGKMNEDVHACYCLALYSNKTIYTNRQLYHYLKNDNGVTNCRFSMKKMDLLYMWDIVGELVECYTPYYRHAWKMNRKRANMTLLIRMIIDGYDKNDQRLVAVRKELKREVRNSCFDLLKWKMPLSRKIMLLIVAI